MTHSHLPYHKFFYHLEQINEQAKQDPIAFIQQMEHAYWDNIEEVVRDILSPGNHCKVIMLAGPSGSGKTTTAYFLRKILKQQGAGATILSLDDFYLGRGKAPLLPNGEHDYEALEALDVPQLRECLASLLESGRCEKPVFDFVEGRPAPEKAVVELKEHDIAILEGIHALNPAITDHLPGDGLIKIYISVKQGINSDTGTVLSPQGIRFVRRLVRDYNFRGSDAERTISMWSGVCRGENLYIRPFKQTSDITINSLHVYEPCVLRDTALDLLNSVPRTSENFAFAQELVACLRQFYPISPALVPESSLLREFMKPE